MLVLIGRDWLDYSQGRAVVKEVGYAARRAGRLSGCACTGGHAGARHRTAVAHGRPHACDRDHRKATTLMAQTPTLRIRLQAELSRF